MFSCGIDKYPSLLEEGYIKINWKQTELAPFDILKHFLHSST